MANTKGKIIIVSSLVLITGITTAIVFSHFRKKKFLKKIYDAINDTKTEQGQQALLNEENQLLGSNAFDPNFWQGKGSVKPNVNLLMPSKMAREIATKIDDIAKDYEPYTDNEIGDWYNYESNDDMFEDNKLLIIIRNETTMFTSSND